MANMKQINDGKIRDVDIRKAFIARNLKFFDDPKKEFVNEFGINSTNIIDLAAFDFGRKNKEGKSDPLFYGFEIKSEQDNIKRLYKQLNAYISFFQIVYVIAHEKHIEDIENLIACNKQFDKVGLIKVTQDLEFTEIRRARLYKPFYSLFVGNLDLEEVRLLAAKHGLPLEGSKKVLLSKVRRYIKLEEIFEGIKDKLYKYYVRKCPACGCKLYYNQNNRGGQVHICYKCGYKDHY